MFELDKTAVTEIKSVLKKFPQITRIRLFGSHAKGTAKESSDIDLAIEGSSLSEDLIAEIALDIDDLMLVHKVDLIWFDKIKNTQLRNHIERVGIDI